MCVRANEALLCIGGCGRCDLTRWEDGAETLELPWWGVEMWRGSDDEEGGVLQELVTWRFANKLLVTGTPLQNSIKELWCLLHFLDPQQFPDCAEFEKRYSLSSSLLNAEEVGPSSKTLDVIKAQSFA